jgi:hypothetical protein
MKFYIKLVLFAYFSLINSWAWTKPGNSGPWGDLLISNMYLEAPDSVIEVVGKPDPIPRWTFARTSLSTIKDILLQAGVEASLANKLTSAPQMVINGADIVIYPKLEDLLQIKGTVRDKLYSEISKYPQNDYYTDPIFILSDDVEEWLADVSLNDKQKEIFRQLHLASR